MSGLLPELYLAYLQAGVQEQARRRAVEASEASRRATRISLGVAVVALVIALAETVSDYFGDKSWQEDQTQLLTEIRDELQGR